MKSILNIVLFNLFVTWYNITLSQGQILVYSDTWHGGITGSGYSLAFGSTEGNSFNINIEQNSIIRKAFLFYATRFFPEPGTLLINENEVILNIQNDVVGDFFLCLQLIISYILELKK